MEKPNQEEDAVNKDLVSRLVVQNEMLYQVTTVLTGASDKVDSGRETIVDGLLLSPSLQVHELKTMIKAKCGIPESEQRLYVDKKPLLVGPLFNLESSISSVPFLTIQLEHVPLTASQRGFYQHAISGDWKLRDEIMAKMMVKRSPQECLCGKKLQHLSENLMAAPGQTSIPLMECSKCHKSNQKYREKFDRCEDCEFTLCTLCKDYLQFDKGWEPQSDPYSMLDERAIQNASSLVRTFNCNTGDRGGACGVRVNSEFNLDSAWKGMIDNDPWAKILHDYVRLIVRLRDETRQRLFQSIGNEKGSQMLQEVERNQILPRGASNSQVSSILCGIYEKPIWGALKKTTKKYEVVHWDLSLYNPDEVVFEYYIDGHSFWDDAE